MSIAKRANRSGIKTRASSRTLETTLGTDYRPGTNLKDDVTGANWSFLLPNLELGHIVCIGAPDLPALRRLSAVARRLTVACSSPGSFARTTETIRTRHLDNAAAFVFSPQTGLRLADDDVDLLFLSNRRSLRQLEGRAPLQEECRRLLKSDGLVYYQDAGPFSRGRAAGRRLAEIFGTSERLWLSPLDGELRSAAPAGDRRTIGRFLDGGFQYPTITLERCRRLLGLKARTGYPSAESDSSAAGSAAAIDSSFGRTRPSLARRSARALGQRFLRACRRLELFAVRRGGESFRRYGTFAGAELPGGPPGYLQRLAALNGVDIAAHQWAFQSSGEYSSRKLLFFLYRPDADAQTVPEFVVKMTRESQHNVRLEREAAALTALYERGVGCRSTMPEVVFAGSHGDLAIVGETAIAGVPFDDRSEFSGNCPRARAAVEFLIELGANTARLSVSHSFSLADGLNQLLDQFLNVYEVTPEHQQFLHDQISAIAESRRPVPLVFQHGDAGRWNVLAVGSDRVAFLDWEWAEPQGAPLWDLFYFLRSYTVGSAGRNGLSDPLDALAKSFLAPSTLSPFLTDAATRYCRHTALSTELVEPLFYTCWMYRALKESTRLPAGRLQHGHYFNLLRLCIDRRDALIFRQTAGCC